MDNFIAVYLRDMPRKQKGQLIRTTNSFFIRYYITDETRNRKQNARSSPIATSSIVLRRAFAICTSVLWRVSMVMGFKHKLD
jgi:hypothetical protein